MDLIQNYYIHSVKNYPIIKRDLLLKFHPDKFPIYIKDVLKTNTNLNEYINFVFGDLLEKNPIKSHIDLIKILNKNKQYISYIPPIWLAIYNLDTIAIKKLLDNNSDPNTFVNKNDIIKYISIQDSTKQSWRLEGNIINVLEFHLHTNSDYQLIKNIVIQLLEKGNNEYIRLLEDIIISHREIIHSTDLFNLLLDYNIDINTKMYFNNKLTLLPFCIANGNFDQIRILFSKCHPNIHFLDSRQNNLLHYAACRNILTPNDLLQSKEIITFLLNRKKWKIDKKNKDNMTAYDILQVRTNVKKEYLNNISTLLHSPILTKPKKTKQTNVNETSNEFHKYKNKLYTIQIGPRGGLFIIVNDKKIYIRKKF